MRLLLTWKDKILDYEIETRFTIGIDGTHFTWKDKILDYEIETCTTDVAREIREAWKDKILDYEIETRSNIPQGGRFVHWLEKIRFSITRLKLRRLDFPIPLKSSWKDKILDYEIETSRSWRPERNPRTFEKIRFSITRLKHLLFQLQDRL